MAAGIQIGKAFNANCPSNQYYCGTSSDLFGIVYAPAASWNVGGDGSPIALFRSLITGMVTFNSASNGPNVIDSVPPEAPPSARLTG
jgi:hypothetical protein